MKSESFKFSVPDHTAHLRGYMDAVGRVLSPGWELVSLSATLLQPHEDVEGIVGRMHRRDQITNWSAEFSELVAHFLGLNERERLGFYLIDLICDFRDFTEGSLCFKIDCELMSDRTLGQMVYLLELESSQRVLLMALRSTRITHNKPLRQGAKYKVQANDTVTARLKSGLSQAQFAAALKISPRTLQQWEQGRRQPSGAAETLLKIVARHPEVLRE
jgi:DNA-binding transcriptional regulator YiaG